MHSVEMHNAFLCFLIATANGPPGGNASDCVQQVPSLANAPNDEKNLRRRREIHEREKRLEFKERGRRTETLSPSLGRMEPDGRIFQPIRAGGAYEHVCLGEGLGEANSVILLVRVEMGCASHK